MKKEIPEIKWLEEVEGHDYPAARSYLNILFPKIKAGAYVEDLIKAPMSEFKAKDIFRASGLSLLGVSNSHVKKNIKKINKGEEMSPILLVRDEKMHKIIVADGYHRLCAVYTFNEDAMIPCKIV